MLSLWPHRSNIILVLVSIFCFPVYAQDSASACGHHDYPPWNWKDGDKIVGVCAEVTETLFAQLGVKVDLSYVGPWKRCQKGLESGKVDINICSFINNQRQAYSTFITSPMGFNENAIFVKKGKEFPYKTWSDLKSKTGAMMLGVSIGKDFDRFAEKNIDIIRVGSNYQAFGLVELERADFTPFGRYSGLALLKSMDQQNNFSVLATPLVKGKLYISMSHKSKYLPLLPELEALMQEESYHHWVNALLEKYTTIYANKHGVSLSAANIALEQK
jgi:polar amino acid transport system substrate-binding protein